MLTDVAGANNGTQNCKKLTVNLILKEGDPEMASVERYIAEDLAKVGITVNSKFLSHEDYIEATRDGSYNLLFDRTWGAPYDPHSYFEAWGVPSHVEYSAIGNLEPPLTREALLKRISETQAELEERSIQEGWKGILEDVHAQAMFVPLWGSRSPFVTNRRLTSVTPSSQANVYPIHTARVVSGSANVTVAPGVAGALFQSLGPIHAHQYFPNQMFGQAWVYEGLVSYGQGGEIVPVLATSWETENTEKGQRITFRLRRGVKFHDGTDFNCSVAKLNFDHVLSDIVRERHSWYGTAQHLSSWTCNTDQDFVLETSVPFYPLLQELTYVRPLVFASAAAFEKGLESHPDNHNSCNSGHFGAKWDYLEDSITCAGLKAPIGTGPFKYVSRESNEDGSVDHKVLFERHEDYWAGAPDIKFLEVQHFDSNEDVEKALLSGDLDMTLGTGPLTAKQVNDFKFQHSDTFNVMHSEVQQHAFLIMNTGKEPTNSIENRRAIVHAINKGRFLEEVFAGLEQPVAQLLPYTAPYCNVDLSPAWGYDYEKARFINCPKSATGDGNATIVVSEAGLTDGVIAGIAVSVAVAVCLLLALIRLVVAEKSGKPMFVPSVDPEEDTDKDLA